MDLIKNGGTLPCTSKGDRVSPQQREEEEAEKEEDNDVTEERKLVAEVFESRREAAVVAVQGLRKVYR